MIQLDRPLPSGRQARITITQRIDGDMAVDAPGVERRRAAITGGRPWSWLHQVHGADVMRVHRPGDHAGDVGDALITDRADAPIAVQVADCVPVVVAGHDSVAVMHAGWRGLMAGVVEATLAAEDGPVAWAVLGPCIRPHAYEFGAAELDLVVARFGPAVRAETATRTAALDVAAAARHALDGSGVGVVEDLGLDTSDDQWFSHRVRAEPGRQAVVAWIHS